MRIALLIAVVITGVIIMAYSGWGLASPAANVSFDQFPDPKSDLPAPVAGQPTTRTIVLGGGCFWCTEGVYERIPGIIDVVSGYAGGKKETAKYGAVSDGDTGHAEVILITYDASRVSLGQILKVFFTVAHDPTTLNRQGGDVGTQYRSAIFFADEDQKRVAEAYIKQLNEAKAFSKPIVTTLEKLEAFYAAEDYHQDYARRNPNQGYIQGVAAPKIEKAEKIKDKIPTPATQPAK